MNSKQIVLSVLFTTIKFVIGVAIVIVIYRGSMMAYDYGYRVFAEGAMAAGDGQAVTVYIPEGASVGEIGEILQSNGLINDAKLFYLQNLVSAHRNSLKPGVYELRTNMDAFEIMEALDVEEETEE